MDIEISTPALLFPAVSLLLLAYTNRFLAVAQLVRMLHRQSQERENCEEYKQIQSLKHRLELTKWMQFFGVLSILLCTLSMFELFLGLFGIGKQIFGLSLIAMCVSLFISLWEVMISTHALNMELSDMNDRCKIKK
ncbi:DUF2721 domain-containing protein [Sulfurospirillum diekertiae]|uniref:DUF2721 domain-containing protein n=1 Tax=Sulfurospirillum diekertiae TaxID=1854492 RepID=A0A6G9VTH7_9BACT|nr:DUF2721 domain-containing protein [Sulfurospirillum diekertiae]QIR76678.1 DUF2721 domain-containing protein [Sulfurospirillum diekertiae]QIR79309.1 DUF2721 domain-containing protein [Sulfurospirillum diekertiae]